MAPLRKLPERSALPTQSILKNSSRPTQPADSMFPNSKKDKRAIKHARLMSKVTKSTSSKPRRRRPNNKLVTTLDALASALPEDDGTVAQRTGNFQDQVNIIKRKSIKSKPGALKRREKLDKGERDRFTKNMAQMATQTSQAGDTSEKWAALRGFINQTLEKRPEVGQIKR